MINLNGLKAVISVFIVFSIPAFAEPSETVDEWVAEALANNASLSPTRLGTDSRLVRSCPGRISCRRPEEPRKRACVLRDRTLSGSQGN